ncbi:hypothetical protein H4R33_002206 [Dimargaris cristalligena]|nr:hypothetical protein H4R33_002206 [Dimargaris cristalligena]
MSATTRAAAPPVPPSNRAKSQLISRLSSLSLNSEREFSFSAGEPSKAVKKAVDDNATTTGPVQSPTSSIYSATSSMVAGGGGGLVPRPASPKFSLADEPLPSPLSFVDSPTTMQSIEAMIDTLAQEVKLLRHQVRAGGRLSIHYDPNSSSMSLGGGTTTTSSSSVPSGGGFRLGGDDDLGSPTDEGSLFLNATLPASICAYCGKVLPNTPLPTPNPLSGPSRFDMDSALGDSDISDQMCCDLCAELLLNVHHDRMSLSISDSASLLYLTDPVKPPSPLSLHHQPSDASSITLSVSPERTQSTPSPTPLSRETGSASRPPVTPTTPHKPLTTTATTTSTTTATVASNSNSNSTTATTTSSSTPLGPTNTTGTASKPRRLTASRDNQPQSPPINALATSPPPTIITPGGSPTTRPRSESTRSRPSPRSRPPSTQFTCGHCDATIDPNTEFLSVAGRKFHILHFICECCQQPLAPTGYLCANGKYYCPTDYRALFATPCHACRVTIEDEQVTALGTHWHSACFVCTTCRSPFADDTFYEWRGKPYCERHWNTLRGSICGGCDRIIVGRYVALYGKFYHPDHVPNRTTRTTPAT